MKEEDWNMVLDSLTNNRLEIGDHSPAAAVRNISRERFKQAFCLWIKRKNAKMVVIKPVPVKWRMNEFESKLKLHNSSSKQKLGNRNSTTDVPLYWEARMLHWPPTAWLRKTVQRPQPEDPRLLRKLWMAMLGHVRGISLRWWLLSDRR